ncbi:MAG: sulfur carrier protein ThiS [Proteobacteria bacterium]|nr:MAG: sulfur carrier protein ThiS [Pseudomonadota bacterium]
MNRKPGAETLVITINGEVAEIAAVPLAEVLASMGFDFEHAAVAVNEEIVFRRDLPAYRLREGDRVEVVAPMSGG